MKNCFVKQILVSIGNKKLNLLARCFRQGFYILFDWIGYLIFYPRQLFHRKSKFSFGKILIIRLDRIGDLILSTPAIRAVRNTFPKAKIHLLINEYTKDLVIGNPNINKLLIYKKDKIHSNYDLAIALHPGLIQNYITFISGAKMRIGYIGRGGGFFLTNRIKDDRAIRIRHEVESALELVKVAGCKTKNKNLEVSLTKEGEKFAKEFFKKNNLNPKDLIIAVHPGARQEYTRWKKEGFAEACDRLIKGEKAKVLLITGKEERKLIDEITNLM